jgi:arylsulfatase A-like enzyme
MLAVCGTSIACSDGSEGPKGAKLEPGERPSRVVLVTLDTLRFDGLMRDAAGTSPMPLLDAWAAKGRVFERHYASSSTTQPTHASLLTGLHPWQHGVSRNGQVLDEEFETVAEVFSRSGYRTGAVVSSFPLHESFGFDQGFDTFDDDFDIRVTMEWSGKAVPNGAFYSLGGLVTEKAVAMIEDLAGPRQFLWFHYFDMHEPYGDADPSESVVTLGTIYDHLRTNTTSAEPLVAHAKRRYLDDARSLDAHLDELLRALHRDADEVDTHVLVVSDHGESFGEGGSLGHGKRLSAEQIRVPCFVISPRVKPARVSALTSSIDVPATLFSLAGLEGAPERGKDLLQNLPDDRRVFGMRRTFEEPFRELRLDRREHLLQDRVFFVAEARGITTGNAGGVLSGPWRDSPGADSGTASGPGVAFRAFEAELDRSSKTTELDAETRAALEALGYVQ